MRTIDLLTYILAPFGMGQILTFASPFAGAVFIGGYCLASLLLEYFLLHSIYRNVPELAKKDIPPAPVEADKNKLSSIGETIESWKIYFNHPVRYAGIGVALLYMTVMGFDSITFGMGIFDDVEATECISIISFQVTFMPRVGARV